MVFSLGGCQVKLGKVDASFVEVTTNCCIQYKHAFACFVPASGTFFENLQFYWM